MPVYFQVSVGACVGQRGSGTLKLELQAGVSCQTLVVGKKLWSSKKQYMFLPIKDITSCPEKLSLVYLWRP